MSLAVWLDRLLHNGDLLIGVRKDSLLVRLGPEQGEQGDEALKEAYVSEFRITGQGTSVKDAPPDCRYIPGSNKLPGGCQ
jgi:hypothetical protein